MNQEKNQDGSSSSKRNFLAGIISGFLADVAFSVKEYLESVLKRQVRKIVKSIMGLVIMILGIIFFFNGLAILVNDYLGKGDWPGYLFLGIGLAVIGFLFRDSKN